MSTEAVIINQNFNVVCILDTYASFIWADEYRGAGEFELKLPAVSEAAKLIELDMYVYSRESDKIMIVESIETVSDSQDGDYCSVKGRSLESILERRIIWNETKLSGNFQNGIKKLLEENIINPKDGKRAIPNFHFVESFDPKVRELEIPTDEDTSEYHGENLYSAIHDLCERNDVGFKVIMDDANNFYFSLYSGTDRSYSQDVNVPVIFSKKYENVSDLNYFSSASSLKTAIKVSGETTRSDETEHTDYFEFTKPVDSGLNRREAFVDSRIVRDKTEIDAIDEEIDKIIHDDSIPDNDKIQKVNELNQKRSAAYERMNKQYNNDIEAFAKNYLQKEAIITEAFDCDLDPYRQFVYGVDFFLGDIVQVDDGYDHQARCRLSEISFTHDGSGDLVIPTFVFIEDEQSDDGKITMVQSP